MPTVGGVLKVKQPDESWKKAGCGGVSGVPIVAPFDQVYDTFTGTAGALNGRIVAGRTWTADSGLQLNGGGFAVNNGAQYTAVGRVTPIGSAGDDLFVALTNLTVSSGYAGGLELARDSSGNQYQVNLNQYDMTVVLYRSGTAVSTVTVPSTTGVTLSASLRVSGSSGIVTVNVGGVDRITYNDSAPLTGRGCSFFLQQLGSNSADAFIATTGVTYSLEFELSTQDPIGARGYSFWDVYCNNDYAGQGTSPDPPDNTDPGENDGPAPYGDQDALWHLNSFILPSFSPSTSNHIQLGYSGGDDYGHVRAMRVVGSDGSIWYGEYPLGVKYGLDTYTKSKMRGALVAGYGDYWLGGDGVYVPYQFNAGTGTYDSYPQAPDGSTSGEMHVYFSIPEGTIGRLKLELPDGSWVREVCDDDLIAGPNMLSSNQSGFETGTTAGWIVPSGYDTLLTAVTTPTPPDGSFCMGIAHNTSATVFNTPIGTNGLPVSYGLTYTIQAKFRTTSGGVLACAVYWYDSAGALISFDVPGEFPWSANDVWLDQSWNGITPPVDAAFLSVQFQVKYIDIGGVRSWIDSVDVHRLPRVARPLKIPLSTSPDLADSFDRSNGPLATGAPITWSTAQEFTGYGFAVSGGTALAPEHPPTDRWASAWCDAGTANMDLTMLPLTMTVSPAVRANSDFSSFLMAGTSGLYSVTATAGGGSPSYTLIGSYSTGEVSGGFRCRVVCSGTTVQVYSDDFAGTPVLLGTFTTSFNITETHAGFYSPSSGPAQVDNFALGSVSDWVVAACMVPDEGVRTETTTGLRNLGIIASGTWSLPAAGWDGEYTRSATFDLPNTIEVGDVLVFISAGHRAEFSPVGWSSWTGNDLTYDDGFFAYWMSQQLLSLTVTAADIGSTVSVYVANGNPTVTVYEPHAEWIVVRLAGTNQPAGATATWHGTGYAHPWESVPTADTKIIASFISGELRSNVISVSENHYDWWDNLGGAPDPPVPTYVLDGYAFVQFTWGQGDGPGPYASGGNPGDYGSGPDYYLADPVGWAPLWSVDAGELHSRVYIRRMSPEPATKQLDVPAVTIYGPNPEVHDPAAFTLGGTAAFYQYWGF